MNPAEPAAPGPVAPPRFTLALLGATGVGKSTLLNTIFGADLAATGIGEPVTRGSHLYRRPGHHMAVLDTEGLEYGRDAGQLASDLADAIRSAGPVHVIWYCVRATDRRFTDVEADLVRQLADLGPPVLLVLTRSPDPAHGAVVELARHIDSLALPVWDERCFEVNAQPDRFAGTHQHGLVTLLEATNAAAPAGVRLALAAAQRLDAGLKRESADACVDRASKDLSGRALPRALRTRWTQMFADVALVYGLPKDLAVSAAEATRELALLRAWLWTGQLGSWGVPSVALGRMAVGKRRSGRADGMGSGLSAGIVTRIVGATWVDVCEEAYLAAYPEPPTLQRAVFTAEVSHRLSEQLPAHLRLFRRRT